MRHRDPEPGGPGPIRGDIIRWVREQKELPMREIRRLGGPTPAYQSNVENGTKENVHADMLARWLEILGVNEAFVRGRFAPYHLAPERCRGLFADIGKAARGEGAWSQAGAPERCQRLLLLIERRVGALAASYTLGLDLRAFEEMTEGRLSVPESQIKALADLTSLEEREIIEGVSVQQLFPVATRLARQLGLTDDDLVALIKQGQSPTARSVRAVGSTTAPSPS